MSNSKKNNKRYFIIEDLHSMQLGFVHLAKEEKCDEVIINYEPDGKHKLCCISPIKIIEKVTKQIHDAFGTIKIGELLGSHVFDYYFKNKKSKALKNREIDSIDISNDFIRFNLKPKEE